MTKVARMDNPLQGTTSWYIAPNHPPVRDEVGQASACPPPESTSKLSVMGRPKELVRRLLDELPDDASFEDIQYHIYVQESVQVGLDAAARGDLIDQEEFERRMAKWLGE